MSPTELLSPDLIRLSLVLGMVLSVFLYEKSHLTTGSIVVPGFLGVHVFEPAVVLMSLVNAWLCFLLIHRLAPRFWMMSSKLKFHALLIASVVLQLFWDLIASVEMPIAIAGVTFSGLGYVIPGLIAHDMSRNGTFKTAGNVLGVSYLVGGVVVSFLLFAPKVALMQKSYEAIPFNFDLVVILLLSTVGSVLLKLKSTIRSAGYVTAAYLVFFSSSPLVLLAIFASALVTYVAVSGILIPSMIIFGRRKFALMLIVGSMVMWAVLIGLRLVGASLPLSEHPLYAAILILIPGLIANDIQRSTLLQVANGLTWVVSWILIASSLYREIQTFFRPKQMMLLLSCLCLSALVLFLLTKTRVTTSTAVIPMEPRVTT